MSQASSSLFLLLLSDRSDLNFEVSIFLLRAFLSVAVTEGCVLEGLLRPRLLGVVVLEVVIREGLRLLRVLKESSGEVVFDVFLLWKDLT